MKKILGILLVFLLVTGMLQAKSVERIDKLITALITSISTDGDITLDPLGTGKVIITGDIDISNDILLATAGVIDWNSADKLTHSEHKLTWSGFTEVDFGAIVTVDFDGAPTFTSANGLFLFTSTAGLQADIIGSGTAPVAGQALAMATGGVLGWNSADYMTHSEHIMTLSGFTKWDFGTGSDVYIGDDKKLYFGVSDFSMEYDEDGNDNMSFDGTDINMNGYSLLNVQLDLSLSQGLAWDQANDTYERLGSIAGIATSQSAGNAYLPIQSDMRRCLLEDAGTINYYIDEDDPIMKDGTTVAVSGNATSQPEFFTTEEDRTLVAGTSDWTNAAAGDAYASFGKTGDLSLTADAVGDYCYITFANIGTNLEDGKRYVLEYDYSETVAGFEFKLTGVTGQTIGDAVAGTNKKLYFTAVEDYAGADELQIMATTAANAQGDFVNFSIKCCQLIDAGGDFVNDGVVAGMYIRNTTDSPDSYAYIMQVEATQLTLNTDIFPDGTDDYEVGTADFSGTDGQAMVEIPKFYYKQYKTGDIFYWYISKYDLAGFDLHPAFWKDGAEVDYRYCSAFEGSMYDATEVAMTAKGSIATDLYASGDKMCSVAGQWAKTNETRSEYRAMALARGTGFRQLDYYLHSAVQLLYLIEYADFNSQVEIGMGRSELSDGDWTADSYIGFTGLSISDGNGTNSVSNGTTIGYLTDYMCYRGIENFYGNVWKMLDGITWDGSWTGSAAAQPVYVTNNSEYFQDAARVNMQFLCNASYIGADAGYIGNLENVTGFIPSDDGGSETTKVCDYYYQYSEVGRDYWRVVLVGDQANDGSWAGVFALAGANASSSAATYFGARLCF